ncbi:MAG: molecular chaperone HtpG [Chlamydiae bacterium CG10_big_fil_rev_8_21_14_0_10_35_9]|nr:MAG: molecular chaperone HtpG [Chlamydiae bacterium CG10_big_fil_rev_8_21_14_0_10_35_9]
MTKGTLSINSENILPIIKKWLYSDKDIFVRELVSNSCDAISKLKVLDSSKSEMRIDITINKEKKTLVISDTGLGMTKEEVEKYIAQIAFSGAEEFVKNYKSEDQFIGHFGLGFYSAYMVAKPVEILTKSYKEEEKAVHWVCDGSSEYTIDYAEKEKVGTQITLHVQEDSLEYLEENKIRQILDQYCKFLPYPIFLNGNQINSKDPLWLKNPKDCSDKDYLEFYRELYPLEPDPVFWIHLNVDYPFHLKGILYFPKIHRQFDANKSAIKLFCNRVFVSDNCKDLFLDYMTVMRGAIDSPDIPLNVSRSYLQSDQTVKQVGNHISKKIADRLSSLFKSDKEKFIETFKEVETIVKLGVLQDEKFYEKSKEFLLWPTSLDNWLTVEEYIENTKLKKIPYSMDSSSTILDLYKEKGIEVLLAHGQLDSALISFLEAKLSDTSFQRIDSEINDSLLDPSKEKTVLDQDGKTLAGKMAQYFQSLLNEKELEVEAKSFALDKIPAMVIYDEKSRRLKEYMMMSSADTQFPLKRSFIINTNHKLVEKAFQLKDKKPELSKKLVKHIYDITLLGQKEYNPKNLNTFISDSITLLEDLVACD